jgi:ABC-type uncharacterized transport system auxiliary subunit
MRSGRRRLLAASAAWPLAAIGSGCGTLTALNDAPRFEFFVLEDLARASVPAAGGGPAAAGALPGGAPPATRIDRVLLVSMGQSQALYDSDRMVFSPDGMSRAFFQYSNWSERPARRLVTLVERRLVDAGQFRSVALSTAGVRGDLVLSLRLDELYLDESSRPPRVRATVLAELLDWRNRTLLGRRGVTRDVPTETLDARGMARASNVAMTAVLDELAAWVGEVASGAPSPASLGALRHGAHPDARPGGQPGDVAVARP